MEHSILVPPRVMREILGLGNGRRPGAEARARKVNRGLRRDFAAPLLRNHGRQRYRASATAVFIVGKRSVVVTVLPLKPDQLAALLWWLMTS